ncbi:hypothetical protein ACFFF5_16850 [Lederbergia wuyishanensis]|uniref:Uncharacterized protein n=1 Tax=Lederbergia wuyishanensis TaxID=1347903 RepID=A0ABU0D9W5_9BACI|nr:hypothetical protein [Lederbergia wuyishanensis]MCJ8008471.1 hypothetical protein [Lederbergia wuyishanensis]MDQ0345214.1 hypothetical protein [Lederbergia wuyishanensis]
MSHEPTQNKIDRAKTLDERNDKDKAFKEDSEKQAQRDQLLMPVDDISNELVEEREKNEQEKRESKSSKEL